MNYVLTDDAEADLRGIVRYTQRMGRDAGAHLRCETESEHRPHRSRARAYSRARRALPSAAHARCEYHYVFFVPRGRVPLGLIDDCR